MTEINDPPGESSDPAPNKRVNYTQGMLLGAGDFRQEQTHFEWKHALGNRLLHGYGTVCGLKVRAERSRTDVNILVEPGYAVSPAGKWIWVEQPQAARLNEWVQRNRDSAPEFNFPGQNQVFVTLCYEELLDDVLPFPGDEPAQPSRILETSRVQFSWTPPQQIAELAAAQFGALVAAVALTADRRQNESVRFLERVASLGQENAVTASPGNNEKFLLWEETAGETIREASVLFVTEICPRLQQQEEPCLLLAGVTFFVDRQGRLLPRTVQVDNQIRPILLSARLQQELFFRP